MTAATYRPIHRLLVANRGEIACRVMRSAHQLGIQTVAVFADPDRLARHVRLADLAVPLAGSTVAETYLDITQLLDAAARAQADAVHPGYGFLAENADFARSVIEAGLVWVGPDPDTVAAMGSKLEAKQIAAAAGVPLPPSAAMLGDDPSGWATAARDVGFPLLVKASAGGGGRGMRLVEHPADLAEAVRAARREAQSAFGDGTVFVERFLTPARHVEVQVLGDRHGALVHLGERECSIQRRHQKIVEEAPSPGITPATRQRLLSTAVDLARSVGYVGVGTVEFLVSGTPVSRPDTEQDTYFLEMNTRLQVEHPVTEAVTRVDLVELQLRVAAGEKLPFTQEQVAVHGHAIEARVCAEDPGAGYLPSTGTLSRWAEGDGVRWDSGIDEGDAVSPLYDPLLAKAIAHASTRADAAAGLARALRTTVAHGVRTNLTLLAESLESADFAAAGTTTDFLDRHPDVVDAVAPADVRAAHEVAAALHDRARRHARAQVLRFVAPGWRNVPTPPTPPRDHAEMHPADEAPAPVVRVHGTSAGTIDLEVDGLRSTYVVTADPEGPDETQPRVVWVSGRGWTSRLVEPARFPSPDHAAAAGGPTAPMPGTVTAVHVQIGSAVTAGETLVVLEAMKMEHRVTAAADGVVESVLVAPGQSVEAHQVLVTLVAADVPEEATS